MVSLDLGNPELASRPRVGRFTLIWVDKASLILMALGVGIIAYLWVLAAIAAGLAGADNLARHELTLGLEIDFVIAGAIWVVLTVIDFAVGGPKRRTQRSGA